MAVVRPRSLIEQWRVLETCVAADKVIFMRAANTGLTGGSTPASNDYDRDIVIINTMYIAKLYVIDEARQVICLPGTTLYHLEEALEPYGREPAVSRHVVLGRRHVTTATCRNSHLTSVGSSHLAQ